MTPRQKVTMIIVCFVVFFCILYLVRRRKLKEEYSWLWLFTSLGLFLLVIRYNFLETLTEWIGAVLPTTTLFIGALLFLMLLCVQFSVIITKLTKQVKNLIQETALLKARVEELSNNN